jgi:hypothetical protein
MGALRLPLPGSSDSELGRRLIELMAYCAVLAVGLGLAFLLADQPFVPMVVMAGGTLLVGWMVFSARYEVTLTVFMAYILLADGYLKLRYGGSLAVLGRDLLLLSIAGGALVRWLLSRTKEPLPPLTLWVVAWVVIVLAQLGNPANGTFGHSIQAIRPHLEFVPLFFLGYSVMRTPERLKRFLWLLLVLAAVNGLVGLAQSTITTDQLAAWGPGYAEKINGTSQISGRGFVDSSGAVRTRPFALGSDQGFGGAVGTLACPAALALFVLSRRRWVTGLALGLAAGTALAVITSQARVSVLTSIVALGIYLLMTTTARKWVATALAVGVGALLTWLVVAAIASGTYAGIFDRYETIAPSRVVSTAVTYRQATIATIPKYMFEFPLGAGLGTVGPGASTPGGNSRDLNGESQFTFLLIETGIAGFIALVGLNIQLLRALAFRVRRIERPDLRLMIAAIGAPLFAKVFAWFGGPSTASTPDSPYLWFVAGTLAWWLLSPSRGAAREP